MTDPFLVPVPPGATHVDLRPHLMPLMLTLGRMAMGHRVAERDIEAMLAKTQRDAPLVERAMRLRPEWVRDYVKSKGWHVNNDYSHFSANIREGEGTISFHSAHITLHTGHKESENGAPGWWKVLAEIGGFEDGWASRLPSHEKVSRALDNIEASLSAVDRLALLA